MSKMIKGLMKLIISIMLLLMILALGTGCSAYKEAKEITDIRSAVSEIRNNDKFVKLEDIDKNFLDAIVAIEDIRFYKHGAIDIKSLMRAIVKNIKAKELVEGGSTITQQVIKNIYFDNAQTFERKVAEMFLAFDLERLYGKDDILELYVNIIYFGDNNYGIKEACNNYFNKEPKDLTFDEATLLAGLPQAPSAYALSENMEIARERQEQVIKALENYRK